MNTVIRTQGRDVSTVDLRWIQQCIADNPAWSRRKISVALATHWDWRNEGGILKDMSTRLLLNTLEVKKLISLPPKKRSGSCPGHKTKSSLLQVPLPPHFSETINVRLPRILPIRLRLVSRTSLEFAHFAMLLQRDHYLGFVGTSGAALPYLFYDAAGRALGALLFEAAAWKCQDRDRFIGWKAAERERGLQGIVNNSRFLIRPQVRVKHLASHVLAKSLRTLRRDWMRTHGYRPVLLETFVEQGRFEGTCYKAANWQRVGQTVGRGRYDRTHQGGNPIKDIYLYGLTRNVQQRLMRW